MNTGLVFFTLSALTALAFWVCYVRPTISLSSTALGCLLVFHGPAYWYYTRRWGLGEGTAFDLYNQAWPRSALTIDEGVIDVSALYYTRISAAVRDADVLLSLDGALALTFVLFCFGVWLADKARGHRPSAHAQALRQWQTTPLLPLKNDVSARILVAAGAAILFMMYFLIRDGQLLKVYTYFATQADEFEKIAMRREMGGSASYAFNLALGTVLPFVAFSLWSWWRAGASSVRWLALALILLVCLAKLATLSKAPAAVFVLQLLVLEFARRSLQISWRFIALLLGASALLFSAMTFVANSDLRSARESLLFLFYRIFMIPNESLLEYFAVFPQQLAHTNGHDIRWLAQLVGVEPLQSTFWRVAETLRGAPGSTTTAMYMADAWAAFSWIGILVVSTAFGFLLRWIDIELIVKRGRSVVTLAGLGLGHYGIFVGLSTAFQTTLLTGGLLLIIPAVVLMEGQWRRMPAERSDRHGTGH